MEGCECAGSRYSPLAREGASSVVAVREPWAFSAWWEFVGRCHELASRRASTCSPVDRVSPHPGGSIGSYVTMAYVIHLYHCYLFLGHLHNKHVSNNT
jgi:hypothetical protein